MKTKNTVFLEGKNVYLRPLELSDLAILQKYVNDPEVRRYLSSIYPQTLQDEEAWLRKIMTSNPNSIEFGVVLKKGNKLLGCMGLRILSHVDGTADTGTMLGAKDEWNKGYASEAKMLLLEYAFLTLNVRKVCSRAYAPNLGSIRHNQKSGYVIEGRLKDHIYREGKYHDLVMLAVFKDVWIKKFKK